MRRFAAALVLVGAPLVAGDTPAPADDPLSALAPIVGSCWEGRFGGSALIDRRCVERILDGAHIRDTHEVVGTGYRGETIYSWDSQAGRIAYTYYNVLGGVARGWIVPVEGGYRGEGIYRGQDGSSRAVSLRVELAGERMVQTSSEDGRETARVEFERRPAGSFPALGREEF